MPDLPTPTPEERKTLAEARKLELEADDLARPWYKRVASVIALGSALAPLIAVLGAFVAIQTANINQRKDNLDRDEKAFEKQRSSFEQTIKEQEARIKVAQDKGQALETHLDILRSSLADLQDKRTALLAEREQLHTSLGRTTHELTEMTDALNLGEAKFFADRILAEEKDVTKRHYGFVDIDDLVKALTPNTPFRNEKARYVQRLADTTTYPFRARLALYLALAKANAPVDPAERASAGDAVWSYRVAALLFTASDPDVNYVGYALAYPDRVGLVLSPAEAAACVCAVWENYRKPYRARLQENWPTNYYQQLLHLNELPDQAQLCRSIEIELLSYIRENIEAAAGQSSPAEKHAAFDGLYHGSQHRQCEHKCL